MVDPRFLRVLVERYGPGGSLWNDHPWLPRPPIRDWQMWNEPNIYGYWPTQSLESFVALLRAGHAALKSADPGARVVLAGMPKDSWNVLHGLYALGAGPYFDVAGVHPFSAEPSGSFEIVRRFRAEMRHAGDGAKPIWYTSTSTHADPVDPWSYAGLRRAIGSRTIAGPAFGLFRHWALRLAGRAAVTAGR